MNLQTSLGLLHRTDGTMADPPDRHGREPFRHPVIDLLPRLTERGRLEIANTRRMANLASQNGMLGVLRWKPRKVCQKRPRPYRFSRSIDRLMRVMFLYRRKILRAQGTSRSWHRQYTRSWARWHCKGEERW